MRTRGIVAAVLLASPFALAACGSSGGDAASSGPVDQVSFQVRPVLSEKQATAADCTSSVPAVPATAVKVERICSADKTIVYSVGPASITESDVTSVAGAERGDGSGERAAYVELSGRGTKELAKITDIANRNEAPANQFALVVDGAVVSAPAVEQGAITGGQLEISFADSQQLDAFLSGWPASKRDTSSVDDEPTVTPAEQRCEALVRAEPEFASLPAVSGFVSQVSTISRATGEAEDAVIVRAFPGADRYTDFVQCSAPLGEVTPTPGAPTCAEGELLLKPEKTWLIDAEGKERLLSMEDAALLVAGDDGSPCS
jgi:hypothetical protein